MLSEWIQETEGTEVSEAGVSRNGSIGSREDRPKCEESWCGRSGWGGGWLGLGAPH